MEMFEYMTDHLVPKERAIQITRPFWSDLRDIWKFAWEDWYRVDEDLRARLSETAFVPPIMLFGFAQSRASELFSNREEEGIVRCTELCGVFGFYLRDKLLIRFNTLNQDGIVRNALNGSERKDHYYRQEPVSGLNNQATRLTVGYLPNATKTGLTSIRVSCQLGDSLFYSFPIDSDDHDHIPPETGNGVPAAGAHV